MAYYECTFSSLLQSSFSCKDPYTSCFAKDLVISVLDAPRDDPLPAFMLFQRAFCGNDGGDGDGFAEIDRQTAGVKCALGVC